jgi:thiosulfate dehydrogenase
MRGFLSGIGVTLVVLCLAIIGLVYTGNIPANADAHPGNFERMMAHTSLDATLNREAPKGQGPLPATDANMTRGAHLYAQNCAVCHGGIDGSLSTIGAGLFQKPPIFAKHGVSDDPVGETYWKIHHGIRFTGMPAYANSLTETAQWQIALFLRHLDDLPPHAKSAWKQIKTPGQIVTAKAHAGRS